MSLIVVSGALANKPFNGGEAWVRLSWLLGLQSLGFQVRFIEQIAPEMCTDGAGNRVPFQDSIERKYFCDVVARFGIQESATLLYDSGEFVAGTPYADLLEIASSTDLLVNISGHLSDQRLWNCFRRKAYVDIDPGFTQFWQRDGLLGNQLSGYDFYFTIGENIGNPRCTIPTCGIHWRTTRQPVLPEMWTADADIKAAGNPFRFTTIANWRGPYGTIEHNGVKLGLKVHEFRKIISLPTRMPAAIFELALNIDAGDAADREALLGNGWRLTDPRKVVPGPGEFRRYIHESSAEFTVAQGIYVQTHSGWFSDRSVRYLAAGKPVLVQDTGLDGKLPVGEGLCVFTDLEDAVAGAKNIQANYAEHCAAASRLAITEFGADRVLGKFVEEIGITPD